MDLFKFQGKYHKELGCPKYNINMAKSETRVTVLEYLNNYTTSL